MSISYLVCHPLCLNCVLGVQEVLYCDMISMSVMMNQSATILRVYDVLEHSLPSRWGSDVISYGLCVVRISYITRPRCEHLGLAVGNRPRCGSTLGLAVGFLDLGDWEWIWHGGCVVTTMWCLQC